MKKKKCNHTVGHPGKPTHLSYNTGRFPAISKRADWVSKERKNNIPKRFIIKAKDSFPFETDGQAKAFWII